MFRFLLTFKYSFGIEHSQIRGRNRDFCGLVRVSALGVYPLLFSIPCGDLLILLIIESLHNLVQLSQTKKGKRKTF